MDKLDAMRLEIAGLIDKFNTAPMHVKLAVSPYVMPLLGILSLIVAVLEEMRNGRA